MSLHFHQIFRKKLQKVPNFVKKQEKSSIFPKLATFRKNYHVFTFRWTLWQKVAKTAPFREKARKLIDLAKTMQLIRTNYHVLVFRWTFEQKVAKSGSIREKARKIIDLAKTLQLFEQTAMSLHFDELFRKKLQRVAQFVKNHEKSSIWPKLSTFRANYHVLAFSWTFQQEVAKTASFRETARKIIDLAKALQLLEQATMSFSFGCFQEKSCKKCVVSWKSTKNHRFCQLATFWETTMFWRFDLAAKICINKARKIVNLAKSLQLFEQTSMFLHFDEFSRKKLQKCFVSWKSTKLPCFEQTTMFRWTAKSCSKKSLAKLKLLVAVIKKTCNFFEQSTMFRISQFGQKSFATFRTNYHRCFCISMNFQGKSCQKCFVSWKLFNFSNKLPFLCISMNF